VVVGASLAYHVRLALARGVTDAKIIGADLARIGKKAAPETIERLLRRERERRATTT
jgi:hypothetical protein